MSVVEPLAAKTPGEQGLGGQAGQSLIETALILPLLLLLAFDAINFGYFFYSAVNLASAPREGAQWSIIGSATPSSSSLAAAGPASNSTTVSFLTYEDMRGALPSYSNATIQVCTEALGLQASGLGTSSQIPNCAQFGGGSGTWTPPPDPEAPFFVLQRVDVAYTVVPLIPQFVLPVGGGIPLTLLPNMTLHRQVSMRAMN
jgi:Flp pilus assembly protein TadG